MSMHTHRSLIFIYSLSSFFFVSCAVTHSLSLSFSFCLSLFLIISFSHILSLSLLPFHLCLMSHLKYHLPPHPTHCNRPKAVFLVFSSVNLSITLSFAYSISLCLILSFSLFLITSITFSYPISLIPSLLFYLSLSPITSPTPLNI